MLEFIAGFTDISLFQTIFIGVLLLAWVGFCIIVGLGILYAVMLGLSKLTGKDLRFETIFLSSKAKKLYPKIVVLSLVTIASLLIYYGLIDN